MVWEWFGNGLGMVWEWFGNGLGMEPLPQFKTGSLLIAFTEHKAIIAELALQRMGTSAIGRKSMGESKLFLQHASPCIVLYN